MRMQYRTCPYCDSNLDPDERCDCRDDREGKAVDEAGQSGGQLATVGWRKPILIPGA